MLKTDNANMNINGTITHENEILAVVSGNYNGHNEVYVGRIRRDFSQPNTLNLWVVADNLRKGAASNAVQIMEEMMNKIQKRWDPYDKLRFGWQGRHHHRSK